MTCARDAQLRPCASAGHATPDRDQQIVHAMDLLKRAPKLGIHTLQRHLKSFAAKLVLGVP